MRFKDIHIRDVFQYETSLYQRVPNVYKDNCCSPTYNAVLLGMPMENEFMALFTDETSVQFIQEGEKMKTQVTNARNVPIGGTVIYNNKKLFRTNTQLPSAPGLLVFIDEDGVVTEIYTYALVEIILEDVKDNNSSMLPVVPQSGMSPTGCSPISDDDIKYGL